MAKRILCCIIALIVAMTLGGCMKLKVPSDVDVVAPADAQKYVPNSDFAGWYDTDRESAFPATFYMGDAKEENKRLVMGDKFISPMNLCVCRVDGSDSRTIVEDCSDAQYYKGWVYYIDSQNAMNKIKPDGTGKTLIRSFSKEQLSIITDDGKSYRYSIDHLKIFEDTIFYCISDKLYRMDLNGQNEQLIQANVELYDVDFGDLHYSKGHLYYMDVENHAGDYDTEDREYNLFDIIRYDIKTGQRERFLSNVSLFLFYNYENRFYYGYEEGTKFYFKVKIGDMDAKDSPFPNDGIWLGERYYQWLLRNDMGSIGICDLSTGEYTIIAKPPEGKDLFLFDSATPDGIYIENNLDGKYEYRMYVENGRFIVEPFKQ